MEQRYGVAAAAIVGILLFHLPLCLSWGHEGHVITCDIAQALLPPKALSAVKRLLPSSARGRLSSFCSWPDWIKHEKQWQWSGPLHFADTPANACAFDTARDCHFQQLKGVCVVSAILNYTQQLLHPCQQHSAADAADAGTASGSHVHAHHHARLEVSLPGSASNRGEDWSDGGRDGERESASVLPAGAASSSSSCPNATEALLFLAHFIGDVHQPLHVGSSSDHGGNLIHVSWFGRHENLHAVWDDGLIAKAIEVVYRSRAQDMTNSLLRRIFADWRPLLPGWTSCPSQDQLTCPSRYANESAVLACNSAYFGVQKGSVLADAYFKSRYPIVEARLAMGGFRLALALTRIFSQSLDGGSKGHASYNVHVKEVFRSL